MPIVMYSLLAIFALSAVFLLVSFFAGKEVVEAQHKDEKGRRPG